MRRGLTLPLPLALALCLLPAGIGVPQRGAHTGGGGADFARIDAYVTARMRSARIPGLALVIVRGNRIAYARGYGHADPSGRPVTPRTPFIIGSVSKPFTALAVMQLVEAGKIELDAPVRRYLPWFRVADPAASARITVRDLLYQTSGIPQPPPSRTTTANDDAALERSVRSLATLKPIGPPGESFAYSNGNYNTLGLIVQAVSGESYERYVRRHIFEPLEMRHSFLAQDEAMRHGMATGYRWWFGLPVAATLPYIRGDLPSGYIIASAEDMAHFLIAQMNGGRYRDSSVLSPEGIALGHVVPGPKRYGMGWESVESDGRTLIDHDGGTPNFQASLFFDPRERVGVFIAANACSALDAVSSPAGSDPRDGPTVRAMALSVLNLATSRPLPAQGIGHETLYFIFDVVLLALTGLLVASLARMPARYRRLERSGITRASGLWRRTGVTALLHLAVPVLVLFLALEVPVWQVLALYEPDLVYWLVGVALALLCKGVLELVLSRRVFNRRHRARGVAAA